MDSREMPIFIKVDGYKELLDVIDLIRGKLDQAKKTLGKINELKNEEDSQLGTWKDNLEEIERKMEMVDSVLFEPQAP